ncbi:TPR repeat-containing thioredoxin TTL1-like isoform X2 [Bidens hawaiensis]|uniref:TPR repeat-containing thioredoxin TTL1-like isoform X2 n=1 Tax=Bidens hawaiensis TaxID=980011 RepID=UPI00404B7C39
MSETGLNKPDFRQLNLGSPVSPLQHAPTPTTTSSASSSSGSKPGRTQTQTQPGPGSKKSNSGEISVNSYPLDKKPGPTLTRTRSSSSKTTVTSPSVHVLPTGNICPSGRTLKPGMMTTRSAKPDVLSSGTCNYGHGSILRRGSAGKPAGESVGVNLDCRELNRVGNQHYKMGEYYEALGCYDRAVAMSPENPTYRCNRAAALVCLTRLTEAVKECDEAIKLDCGYKRAHRHLGSLFISLGQVENARKHICFPGCQLDQNELKRLQLVENHLNKCTTCRTIRDWVGVIRECDAAMASGANSCPQLYACKAEAFLKLWRLNDADATLLSMPMFRETCSVSYSQPKLFGMAFEAYILFVRAQVDMAFGRFEDAVTSIEKLGNIDSQNVEIAVLVQNIRAVVRARSRGDDLFKSEKLMEACSAYSEGIGLEPVNPVLYCNRGACWFKLGQMELSLDDCNQALIVYPNYTKALLRRAMTYSKLDRWAESVSDYEVVRRELPDDNEIAECLFHAQVALKKSLGEEVYNMQFGGEVESVTSLDQFKSVISSTGASVVLFKSSSDHQCKNTSLFLDTLCTRYPSIIFLKVDVEESSVIAKTENVRIVPTIKIYKKGNRVKEIVCPCQETLELSVKHYNS